MKTQDGINQVILCPLSWLFTIMLVYLRTKQPGKQQNIYKIKICKIYKKYWTGCCDKRHKLQCLHLIRQLVFIHFLPFICSGSRSGKQLSQPHCSLLKDEDSGLNLCLLRYNTHHMFIFCFISLTFYHFVSLLKNKYTQKTPEKQ